MSRQTVLLLFGGESPEHEVSIMSARNIYAAMDNSKYDVLLCYIDKHGKWWLLDSWKDNVKEAHGGLQLVAAMGSKAFITIPGNRMIHPNVLYPAMHGDTAEDGVIQGLAKLLHIPIVGSGLAAHAVGWDKLFTKQLLERNNISVVPYVTYYVGEQKPSYESATEKLASNILFVKPTRAGSSIGVSKVTTSQEFNTALELAAKYSNSVLIEKAIKGRELEVAVLGNPPHHKASDVGEIKPSDDFYSYEEKYAETSQTEVLTHTELEPDVRKTLRETAADVFQYLGCRGQARVDFFLGEDGTVYVNEINTLPGFTNISQYPKLWHEQGIKYPELIDKLIALALQ
jgi:D-alanine-D-alanine ligase